jgi:fibronectin-binding autotransporter adhesin
VTFADGQTTLHASGSLWAGGTTVSNGSLILTDSNALPSGTTVSLNGGTLDLDGTIQTIGGLTSVNPGADWVTSAGPAALTISLTEDAVYAGRVGGPVNLTKSGSATWTLTGDHEYTGDTVIEAGMLILAETGQIDPLSEITNDATFVVDGGAHVLGIISGTGVTQVTSDAQVTVSSVVQNTLIIGGEPPSAGGLASQPVPEPATWLLLASLGAGWGTKRWFKKRRFML